jgi:hypothetical protein
VFHCHRVLGWVWVVLTVVTALALAWELAVRPLTEVGPHVTVVLLLIAAYSAWGHLREARALAAGLQEKPAA